jgi:hypothetical protein
MSIGKPVGGGPDIGGNDGATAGKLAPIVDNAVDLDNRRRNAGLKEPGDVGGQFGSAVVFFCSGVRPATATFCRVRCNSLLRGPADKQKEGATAGVAQIPRRSARR